MFRLKGVMMMFFLFCSVFGCDNGDGNSTAGADDCLYVSPGQCSEDLLADPNPDPGASGDGIADENNNPANPPGGIGDENNPTNPTDGNVDETNDALDPKDPKNWVNLIKGMHLQVFYDATDGESSTTGSVYVIGGETFDLYLCSDMTCSGTYKDTTCVTVYIPNDAGDGNEDLSNCDEPTEAQGSGTWKVEMGQNDIPYLAVAITNMEILYFSLGSDGTNLYLDEIQASVEQNPLCN